MACGFFVTDQRLQNQRPVHDDSDFPLPLKQIGANHPHQQCTTISTPRFSAQTCPHQMTDLLSKAAEALNLADETKGTLSIAL
jgi:hypothetical protein